MITITINREGKQFFAHEVLSYSLGDALSAYLSGSYVELGLQKGTLYTVEISDGDTVITKLCMFLSYQFNVQTYQQTVDGVPHTQTGVTNNSLVFALVE